MMLPALALGGIIEKSLFRDLIPFPPLVCDLLHLGGSAIQPNKAEFPTYDDSISIHEDGPHAFRRYALRPGENGLFTSNELVAAFPWFFLIFLHGSIFGIKFGDRLVVFVAFYSRNKSLERFVS